MKNTFCFFISVFIVGCSTIYPVKHKAYVPHYRGSYIDQAANEIAGKLPAGWELLREKNVLYITTKDTVWYFPFAHDLNPDMSYDLTHPRPDHAYSKSKVFIKLDILFGTKSWTDAELEEKKAYNANLRARADTIRRRLTVEEARYGSQHMRRIDLLMVRMPFFHNCAYTVLKSGNFQGSEHFYARGIYPGQDFEKDYFFIEGMCKQVFGKWFD